MYNLKFLFMVKSFVSLVEVVVDEKNNPVIVFRSSDGKPLEIAHNFEDCGDVLRSFLLTNSDK